MYLTRIAGKYHDITPEDYEEILEEHNATYMVEVFRNDCKYDQMTKPQTYIKPEYKPPTLYIELYGI